MAVSRTLRFQILRRDNHRCQSCGRSALEVQLEVDHVLPEALGGPSTADNLRALCSDCNGGKSATPPDAAVVAQVSADALRWGEARKLAAAQMLSDLESRNQSREAFDEAWRRWSNRDSQEPIPRDSDWPNSVDNLLAAGLPLPILLDCVEKAMLNSSVPADRAFRYTCGIAWRLVRELGEAATDLASEPQPSRRDGRISALADEVMQWTDEVDRKHLRDQAFIESPADSDDAYETQLIVAAVQNLYSAKITYRNRARLLMEGLPESIRARVLHEAEAILFQADHTEDDLLSVALTALAYEVERNCEGRPDWPGADDVA